VTIQDDARIIVLVADHVGIDGGGKANILGAGVMVVGVSPQGLTAPMHVLVIIDAPGKYAGHEFALSVELRDETTGEAFKVVGPSGAPEPLRVQQVVTIQRPTAPNLYLPPSVGARVQTNLAFPNGLPLGPGHDYLWQVEMDGQHRKSWRAGFHVLGPPPPAVLGGQTGPARIPNIAPPSPPTEHGT
jgi:hypothetical protein